MANNIEITLTEINKNAMSQKLDSLSKILVATGQINYMAASINGANEQLKFLPDKEGFMKEGIKEMDEFLNEVVVKLSSVLEDMGNLINARDCICHIDTRVSKVPFEILIQGMDDVEYDYDSDKEN